MKNLLILFFLLLFPLHALSQNSDPFKVVTWNIEWFGSAQNGPSDKERQLNNVVQIMNSLKADIYALQEIVTQDILNQVTNRLEGNYRGFIAEHITQNQKLAYIYNTATVDSIQAGGMTFFTPFYWASRLPYRFFVEVNKDGYSERVTIVNVHAKAFADESSYNRRVAASNEMYPFLVNQSPVRYIFLGDFNDDVIGSTRSGEESPYKNFVDDDTNFKVLTTSLSQAGAFTYSNTSGTLRSMLDHIVINKDLFDYYVEQSIRIYQPAYITSYLSTTSDHFPVKALFDFNQTATSVSEFGDETPSSVTLEQNYPNPFNPSTTIRYQLSTPANVQLEVFDMLGRKVATLVNGRVSAGSHEAVFDASRLSTGMYIYRLRADGKVFTRQMMLIK
jgi:endonuclease/exonuclease/phosphatase family metal-dependent hydrolase